MHTDIPDDKAIELKISTLKYIYSVLRLSNPKLMIDVDKLRDNRLITFVTDQALQKMERFALSFTVKTK